LIKATPSAMRTYTDHAICSAGTLAILALIDRLAISPFIEHKVRKSDVSSTRWFLLHWAANMFVCLTALIPLYTAFTDPYNAASAEKYSDDGIFAAGSAWPLTFVNAVHVYHMIGGFSLSSADYFHHLLFIPLLGFPGQVLSWGPAQAAGAFFISGLPGGLTYLMLAMVKLGWMNSIKEKRVTANLNSWVRVPGILITSFLVYQAAIYGNHSLNVWFMVPSMLLGPYNALYYNKQAVANFTVHYMTQLLGQDDVFKERLELFSKKDMAVKSNWQSPTSSAIMQWKEAIANPQRGC